MRDVVPFVLSRVFCLALAGVAVATPAGAQARTPGTAAMSPVSVGERIVNGLHPLVRVTNGRDTAYTLTERMRHHNVPGVSIAVIDHGRIVWAQGFGVAEAGGTQRVDTTTLFQAASISKPVFATAMLTLVEQGRLRLDADVTGQLRSWRLPESGYTAVEKVTLRRLLSHTAGLTVSGFRGYAKDAPMPAIPQVLDGSAPANSPAVRSDTVPGAQWSYSGGGYTVAQLLATDVTGDPLPALLQRLVLRPFDMPHSTFEQPLPTALARHAASGHRRQNAVVPGRHYTYPEMAAAGLWTTPSDLARWAIGIAGAYGGNANTALSTRSARAMLTPQVALPAQATWRPASAWGLGVELVGASALRFMHDGHNEGFFATLVMYPALGRGLVVMANGPAPAAAGNRALLRRGVRSLKRAAGGASTCNARSHVARLDARGQL